MSSITRNITNIPAMRFAQLIDQKKVKFTVRNEKTQRDQFPAALTQIQKIKSILALNTKAQETVPKQSYTIQEDLTILSAVHDWRAMESQEDVQNNNNNNNVNNISNNNNIVNINNNNYNNNKRLALNFWQQLQKKGIKRSIESMRDRYKRFLKFLSNEDLSRILGFIQTQGIKGQLIFNKKENSDDKVLENIISEIEEPQFSFNFEQNPNNSRFTSQQTSVATTSLGTYLNYPSSVNQTNLSTIMSNNQRILIPQNLKRASNNNISYEQQKILRKIIPENSQFVQRNQQIQRTKKEIKYLQSKVDQYFQNYNSQFQQEQQQANQVIKLNDVISQLARYLHKKENTIIEEIEKFNGSIENLIHYNQDPVKYKHFCWDEKEDKILQQAEHQSNLEFQFLVEQKGIKQILDRIQFKKIVLKFEFK